MVLRCETWAQNHLIDLDVSQLTDYRHWIILNQIKYLHLSGGMKNQKMEILEENTTKLFSTRVKCSLFYLWPPPRRWCGRQHLFVCFFVGRITQKRTDGGRVSAQHRPCWLLVLILKKKGDGSKNFYSLLGRVLFDIFVLISQKMMRGCWRKIPIKQI